MEQPTAADLRRTLIEGLDTVLAELRRMDDALVAADRSEDLGMIREARRRIQLLDGEAQRFFTWVTDTRLDPPAN